MRPYFLILFCLACLFSTPGKAQSSSRCGQAIDNAVFKQHLNNINRQENPARKLEVAKQVAREQCLSSAQVKLITKGLGSEYHKLEFAQEAYHNTFDPSNFYEVYDAFSSFSVVFRLHDWILAGASPNTTGVPASPTLVTFPKYPYPNALGYKGAKGCPVALSDGDFHTMVATIAALEGDALRQKEANRVCAAHCLSTAQIMKLASLLQLETNRLSFSKSSYSRAFDLENYPAMIEVFSHQPNQENLKVFIQQHSVRPEATPCGVNQQDFAAVKNTIAKQEFNHSRIAVAKQVIESKKCFQSIQVLQLVQLMDFENAKLEIAKFAYAYTVDPENFLTVLEAFTFDNSKRDLTDFVASQQ